MKHWRGTALPAAIILGCLSGGLAVASPAPTASHAGHAGVATRATAGHDATSDSTPYSKPGAILKTPHSIMKHSAKPGAHWHPGKEKYGVGSHLNRAVTGAHGTTLRADVYFPTNEKTGKAAKGPFPVLLIQSPYGKSTAGASGFAASTGEDPYLVKHGFIDVVSDVRGTGDSQGQFGLFDPVQTKDSVKMLHWAARRKHSSHKVGLYGASYLGIDQIRTAGAVGRHSPLKAIFPVVSGTDLYRDTAFMGGILDSEFGAAYLGLTGGLNIINPLASPQNLAGLTAIEIQHLIDLYTFDATFTAKTLTGAPTAYDQHYWKQRQPDKSLANMVKNHIPAYLIGGEYDLFQRGEPLNYAALQNLADGRGAHKPMRPGQHVTGRYQLWDGPFTHLSGSAVNTDKLMLRWFDTWLKGEHSGMANTPTPLHYYDLGTSKYHETTTYPFTGLRAKRYYFAAHHKLKTHRGPSGKDTLVYSPTGNPCGVAVDQWAIGPLETAEQVGGINNLPCLQNNAPTAHGPTVLSYTSAPMKKSTTIGGPMAARIYASATTKDTEWVAEIEDVNRNGRSRPLTEGALLGSLRATKHSRTWRGTHGLPLLPYHPYTSKSAKAVKAGKVTRYDIEIFPTLDTLKKGHRLRITLTTADSPHLTPSTPVVGKLAGGVYTIRRTKAKPSTLEIPVGKVRRN
jgi:putative CocE/NonD family hydrolase